MTEKHFRQVSDSIRSRKYGELIVNLINKLITFLVFASYPVLILYIFYCDRGDVLKCIIVPAISFAAVTMFRNIFNAKRPYEIYDFDPVIKKDTSAHSFPSRHVFSAFMIAMTYLVVDPRTSIDIFVMAAILGGLLVVGGVHFVKDVVSGAVIGILAGFIGYFIIF